MTAIRRLREMRGITQSEFAMKLGVTASAISHWETGRRKPGIDDVVRMAKILVCTVDELLAEE